MRLLEDYVVIPHVLGEAVGLSPLVVLFSVVPVGVLFGGFAVLLAIPLARCSSTLVDVIVLDKDPAEEEVSDFSSRRRTPRGGGGVLGGFTSGKSGLAPTAEDEAAERDAEPEGADGEAADRDHLAPVESRCQRPSASCSSVVSGSPRRCLRTAPPARRPR